MGQNVKDEGRCIHIIISFTKIEIEISRNFLLQMETLKNNYNGNGSKI